MFLLQSFYLENTKKSILYNENNKLFSFSNIGNSTFYVSKINNILINNNNILFFLCYNNSMPNNINYSINQIRQFLLVNFYGLSFRFRMIGRGYYLYSQRNVLYFRLGFSHVIKYVLPLDIELKKKKKKHNFWVLHGLNVEELSLVNHTIRSLRGPNLYSKRIKGISLYNEFIPRGNNSFSKF